MIKVFLVFAIIVSSAIFADDEFPLIFDTHTHKKIGLSEIKNIFSQRDVLIIGEEHDDLRGHAEKFKLIKFLEESLKFSLSLEFLEKDQQTITDEFCSDIIGEKTFFQEIRGGQSFKNSYGEIVRFAKAKKIKLIASNVPRRYANLVSRKGLDALWKLSDESKRFLPPIQSVSDDYQKRYEDKLLETFKAIGHHGEFSNFLNAQMLWDASMSNSILSEFKTNGKKIIHIVGKFHSDDGLGITSRLRKMKIKTLTISMFPKTQSFQLEKNTGLADIIYLTGHSTNPQGK